MIREQTFIAIVNSNLINLFNFSTLNFDLQVFTKFTIINLITSQQNVPNRNTKICMFDEKNEKHLSYILMSSYEKSRLHNQFYWHLKKCTYCSFDSENTGTKKSIEKIVKKDYII